MKISSISVNDYWRLSKKAKEALRNKGFYAYDLREYDDGSGEMIEKSVLVNYFGTVITNEPIKEIEEVDGGFIPSLWDFEEGHEEFGAEDYETVDKIIKEALV